MHNEIVADFGFRHPVVAVRNVVLNLPRSWCRQHDLKKGSLVRVLLSSDGDLIVRSAGERSENEE